MKKREKKVEPKETKRQGPLFLLIPVRVSVTVPVSG